MYWIVLTKADLKRFHFRLEIPGVVPTGVLGQIRAELRANVYKATPPFDEWNVM